MPSWDVLIRECDAFALTLRHRIFLNLVVSGGFAGG
jgi:hypothetical protein